MNNKINDIKRRLLTMSKRPTVLMILDGYGLNRNADANAVIEAYTPVMDTLMDECPFVSGNASGLAVGLPDGQMGNSEVGHLNIGAGRIVYQELTRITKEIEDGVFFENEAFMNNTVQGENIPETEDKNVENLPVIDELCVYLKVFHARSKCILVFTENGYAVNDKKKVIENLNPFLKYKLLVFSKDSMKGGTPIYMELISEQ